MTIEKNIHIMKLSFSQRWYYRAIIVIFIAFTFEKCLLSARRICYLTSTVCDRIAFPPFLFPMTVINHYNSPLRLLQFILEAFSFFVALEINRVVQHFIAKNKFHTMLLYCSYATIIAYLWFVIYKQIDK